MHGLLIALLGGLAGAALGSFVTWRIAKHTVRTDAWRNVSTAVHDYVAACRLINVGEEPYSALVKPEEALRDAINFCGDAFQSAAGSLIELGKRFAGGEEDVSKENLDDAAEAVDVKIREQARQLTR